MEDVLTRIAENLVDRVSGPMKLRLLLQPLVATVFAVRSGLKDAKAGKPPYFWALLTSPEHRADMVNDGWKDVGRVFLIAMIMDVIYQLIAIRFVYPFEVVLVAFLLAIVPYLLLRGLVTRIAR